ncbi:MAG: class I SAM-dependent methyltransferase [Pseudomonadales bacterium]|nr:class I SAM-dependent methyltransferase [Pseudomonadales bacterium]
MSNRSDLDLSQLYPYLFENSVREEPLLKKLREETAKDQMARMQIAPEQGQFMALLLKLMNAKRVIEIGTFTGYSSLVMAAALPEDGHIVCCDVDEYWTSIAKRYWQEAGLEHKLDLRLAPALDTLNSLLKTEGPESFDAAFLDADKANYDTYYERCLELIKPGGLMMLDNVLWSGRVIDPEVQDEDTVSLRAINAKLKQDQRVDISMLPLADGLTLARKRT